MRRGRRRWTRRAPIGVTRWVGAAAMIVGLVSVGHAGHANMVNALDVDYIRAQYDKGRKLAAIDLRSPDEFRQGHLPGARSLPMDQLTARFQEVPRQDLVVLYCDCARSEVEVAYWFLRRQGWRNLSVLEPGFTAWGQRGYPVER
jgi:rhodanese-related sulfurtransferase